MARNKRFTALIKLSISLILLGYLFYRADISALGNILKNASVAFIVFAFALRLLAIAISSKLWHTLLHPFIGRPSLRRILKLYFMSYFFNIVTPGGIGGDAMKVYELSREYNNKTLAITMSVVVERGVGLFVSLTLASIAVIIGMNLIGIEIKLLVWGLLVFYLLAIFLISSPRSPIWRIPVIQSIVMFIGKKWKVEKFIKEIQDSIHLYRNSRSVMIKGVLASLTFWIITVINVWVIALSLNLNVPFHYFVMAVPLIATLVMLPISIQGLGVREATYVFFFTQVGVSAEAALSMSLISLGFTLLISIIGGIMYGTKSGLKVFQ